MPIGIGRCKKNAKPRGLALSQRGRVSRNEIYLSSEEDLLRSLRATINC